VPSTLLIHFPEASPCDWTPGNWDVRFQRK
jgi:hypothetical protein